MMGLEMGKRAVCLVDVAVVYQSGVYGSLDTGLLQFLKKVSARYAVTVLQNASILPPRDSTQPRSTRALRDVERQVRRVAQLFCGG